MSCVIKKNKKPLLARVIGKIKTEPLPYQQDGVASDVPLNEIRTGDDDIAIIVSRRGELRAVKHGGSDAMVIFNRSG